MRRELLAALLAFALIAGTLLPVQIPTSSTPTALVAEAQSEPNSDAPVCDTATPAGFAHCDSRIRTDTKVRGRVPQRGEGAMPNLLGNGGAYDPAFLQSAYNLAAAAGSRGAGRTVAIVDAFDAPTA